MMTSQNACGVIFDMDGVLVDSADHHFQSWQMLAEELDAKVTREQFDQTFGRQNRDIIPIVFGETDEPRVKAMADRKEELYRDLIRANPPIVSGATELIQALATEGVSLAVGSSAPRANVELVLDAMGVASNFGAIVSGDEVSRGKPDPQVFTLCCEALELSPERCVVVEDAPAGVAAAIAAGTAAVAVMIHHEQSEFQDANLCVRELQTLSAQDLLDVIADR